MTPHLLLRATCGLTAGLVLPGAMVCLVALRLSAASRLLVLLGSTATGLLVLTGQGFARRRRLRVVAARGIRDVEAWLRRSPRRAESAP